MGETVDSFNNVCLDFLDDVVSSTRTDEEMLSRVRKQLEYALDTPRQWDVPDFRPGLEWLNVTEPLSLRKDLRGKIVLLDFFTYCCINCMHVLPDLKQLEREFPVEDGLVVIGVHVAKFTNEKNTANVESAVRRYEVSHPVVNDVSHSMWDSLEIRCWPTLYILGAAGEPLLVVQGEGNFRLLKMFVSEAISMCRTRGDLSTHRLAKIQQSRKPTSPPTVLSYPGKININRSGTAVGVSDTANHRVLVLSLDGDLLDEIGGLESGLADGNFTTARFNSPQGLAFHKDVIFVADTENHCIREINLTTKSVTTIVGNGKQGVDRKGGLYGVEQSISSPWDVCVVNNVLFIAMAGSHQIWAYFLEDTTLWKREHGKGTCAAVVGSGREENRNNHYPMMSGLAQPSGIAWNNAGVVAIADSESSTVRTLNLQTGAVAPLVGGSLDPHHLFGFGDVDGTGIDAKLQHPLGVTWSPYDGSVYVADSYNHKIKKIDKDTRKCTTVGDYGKYNLNEPGGLCALGDKLLIADTNNHSIKIMSLPSNTFTTLDVNLGADIGDTDTDIDHREVGEYRAKLSRKGGILRLSVTLALPEGVEITPGAPSKWIVTLPGNRILAPSDNFTTTPVWEINVDGGWGGDDDGGDPRLGIKCRIFYCRRDKCYVEEVKFSARLELADDDDADADADSRAEIKIHHRLALNA